MYHNQFYFMKPHFLILIIIFFIQGIIKAPAQALQKPRLLILTDIGGDPDDQQSLIRLCLYANEFDMEGFIASASGTPGELKEAIVQPQLIQEIIEAYGKVRDNLLLHHPDYPGEAYLQERIKSGNPQRGLGHIGEGHDTEGSEWVIQTTDKNDTRPLNIAIWGGQTDLAQALWKVKNTRSQAAYEKFIAKLRIYDIADQDGIYAWMMEEFPGLFYILNKVPEGTDKRNAAFRGMYLGGDESLTSLEWINAHVREKHGPLGALYPPKTWTAPNPHGVMKEGDTPSWFYFLPNGLSNPAHPEWGSWGGRFTQATDQLFRDAIDQVDETQNHRTTVWRWRPDFQNDFQARMDWCVLPYEQANHAPQAIISGYKKENTMIRIVSPGEKITFDASSSTDPDGDALTYKWFTYPEPGAYQGKLSIPANASSIQFTVPEDFGEGSTLHILLLVKDDNTPRLCTYKRIILKHPK